MQQKQNHNLNKILDITQKPEQKPWKNYAKSQTKQTKNYNENNNTKKSIKD